MINLQELPVMSQRQDSVNEQLQDLYAVANRLGMYDAADAIKQKFGNSFECTDLKYGCHCDLEPHMTPDDCVIDKGEYHLCTYAKNGMRKEQCKYWKIIANPIDK